MKRTLFAGALAGLMGLSLCVPFVPSASARPNMVASQDARLRTQKLTQSIEWNRSFDRAKMEAQRSNKPIFWVHMLGSIDGHT